MTLVLLCVRRGAPRGHAQGCRAERQGGGLHGDVPQGQACGVHTPWGAPPSPARSPNPGLLFCARAQGGVSLRGPHGSLRGPRCPGRRREPGWRPLPRSPARSPRRLCAPSEGRRRARRRLGGPVWPSGLPLLGRRASHTSVTVPVFVTVRLCPVPFPPDRLCSVPSWPAVSPCVSTVSQAGPLPQGESKALDDEQPHMAPPPAKVLEKCLWEA